MIPPPATPDSHSRLGLVYRLADDIPPLLLGQHDAETTEIVKRPSLLGGSALLCPTRLVPLHNGSLFLQLLFDSARSRSTGEFCEFERGQRQVFKREGLAGD